MWYSAALPSVLWPGDIVRLYDAEIELCYMEGTKPKDNSSCGYKAVATVTFRGTSPKNEVINSMMCHLYWMALKNMEWLNRSAPVSWFWVLGSIDFSYNRDT